MKHYKFELTFGYELDAESEDDAINEVADLIRHDWQEFIDEGDLTEVETALDPAH